MISLAGYLVTTEQTLYKVYLAFSKIDALQAVTPLTAGASVQFWITVRGVRIPYIPLVSLDANVLMDVLEGKPPLRLEKGAIISGLATTTGVAYYISGEETNE